MIKISVCHPTRSRPYKAIETRKKWLEASDNPGRIEYIFGFSEDDIESKNILSKYKYAISPAGKLNNPGGTAVQNYNAATNASSGDIVITSQDDVIPPKNWDSSIENLLYEYVKEKKPAILQINDGYREDKMMVTFCITESTFDFLGYGNKNILSPEYMGVFSDTEFSLRAQKSGLLIDSDLVFKHEHPFFNKNIDCDDIYKMENSYQAYIIGLNIFRQRNPSFIPKNAKLEFKELF